MIACLARLRKHPAVFRSLTGLTPDVFDALLADVLPALDDADFARHDRPNRDRAVGAGRTPGLEPPDRIRLAVVWLRVYPTYAVLGYLFGVSESAARRLAGWSLPVLAAAGKDTMRMPDPGRHHRRDLPAVRKHTPGLTVLVDSFEQPTHRPKRRQRAYYSGKKKAHTLKSQVGVDEVSGRFVDVSDSVPGPWADIKLLKKSRLLRRLPAGVGGIGDLAYVGIADLHPEGLGRPPGGSPGVGTARPRTGSTTARSADGGSWSSTPSGGCGGSGRWPTSTGTGGRGMRPGFGRSPGWSTGCSPTPRLESKTALDGAA